MRSHGNNFMFASECRSKSASMAPSAPSTWLLGKLKIAGVLHSAGFEKQTSSVARFNCAICRELGHRIQFIPELALYESLSFLTNTSTKQLVRSMRASADLAFTSFPPFAFIAPSFVHCNLSLFIPVLFRKRSSELHNSHGGSDGYVFELKI